MYIRNISKLICIYIILISSQTSYADKTVFIISNHDIPSKAEAFEIDDDQIYFQNMVAIDSYNPENGAVGIDVWPEKELMFVTYESSDFVAWSSTKTLQFIGRYDTDVSNLAGVVVDTEKEKIYIMKRNYSDLNVYTYNHISNTLLHESTMLLKNQYSQDIQGWGLALDDANNLLYVTTNSKTVYVYDTNNWTLVDYFDIRVAPNDRPAIGIAVDPVRGYLYTGHFNGISSSHTFLVKTGLSDPHTSTEINAGTGIVGIDVDLDTGLIYCTTANDQFRVYNTSLSLRDTETNSNMTSPAGVSVGGFYKEPRFSITKDNNDIQNNCVSPGDYVTFNITWDANETSDSNVFVIDYLPVELELIDVEPNTVDYNWINNTVTLHLPDFDENSSGSLQITAKVNAKSIPCDKITNLAIIEGDNYATPATEDVNVCPWTNIIYVNANSASNYKTGTTWEYAYSDLQDALERARNDECVSQIWVAGGNYKPVYNTFSNYYEKSFELVNGVSLYGHFAGIETTKEQRDFYNQNNKTILDGLIDPPNDFRVYNVIKGETIYDCNINGFTIQSSSDACVYLIGCNVAISDCNINNSYTNGIYASSSTLSLTYGIIRNNTSEGINLNENSNTKIINNWIYDNLTDGIFISNYSPGYAIRNNTICGNGGWGIDSSYSQNVINMRNCIIRNNSSGDLNGTFDVNYCCLQTLHDGDWNFTGDPSFYDIDKNNFHLMNGSPCIDTGDSNGIPSNETDIDGEGRIKYEDIDVGADEYYLSPADINGNDIVDFYDYMILANAWKTSSGEPNYYSVCDLKKDEHIDSNDLELFCEDWLWRPGWLMERFFGMGEGGGEMMMGFVPGDQIVSSVTVQEEEKLILTESDVKETLDWMDKVQLEAEKEGLLTDEGYAEFRQILEKDLMSYVETSEK